MVTKDKSVRRGTSMNIKMSPCEAIQISIRMGACLALALFLLTGIWGIREYVRTLQEPVEMSFTGTGERVIENDTAEITFSFSDFQQDVSSARDTVSTHAQNAYILIAQSNIDGVDIQTTGYTIYPEYEYPSPETFSFNAGVSPKFLGYRVSHTSTVTARNIEDVGTLLTMLTDLNPETVTGPLFAPDEEEEKYAEDYATERAIHNAKIRAHKVAQSSGFHLKKITRINTYKDILPPHIYGREPSAFSEFDDVPQSKTVPIHRGERKVRQTAVITYEVTEQKNERRTDYADFSYWSEDMFPRPPFPFLK